MKLLLDRLSSLPPASPSTRPALMTHVVLGYPSLKESVELVKVMAENGADFVELQIPFSDPIADGPTIMAASEAALSQGITPTDCMRAMEQLSKEVSVPLLFMTYCNLVFAYRNSEDSLDQFCRDAANAGAQGLIVPDVPPEENTEGYWTKTLEYKLLPIPLVSPVSSEARLKKISSCAKSGFVYCVSTTGTTGARNELPAELTDYLSTVKEYFSIPRAVGFGISTGAHVENLSGHAEIAIVGSAMLDRISRAGENRRNAEVAAFTAELAGIA